MGLFGRKKDGSYYKKKDNSEHPVTFADAYKDEDEDLKDKNNFADERIAEQEEKEKLDGIKAEQDKAENERKLEESRKGLLEKADDIMVSKKYDVDDKINALQILVDTDDMGLTSSDKSELREEIKMFKEMKKSINASDSEENAHEKGARLQEKIEDRIDKRRAEQQAKKNGSAEVKQSRKEFRKYPGSKPEKDHSNESNLHPDESARVSYLLATASDDK